jgi:hypothetical protein
MATLPLHVDVLMSKESGRIITATARAARVVVLREIAKELNDRADVIEAANKADKILHPEKPESEDG